MSTDVTEMDLRDAFKEYGEVSFVNVVMDRHSSSSKGFAFIEMPNESEGKAAITGLNGQIIKGKAVVVNEARPKNNA